MKKYILSVLSLVFLMSSCTDISHLNIDPNNPTNAGIPLVFTAGEEAVLYKFGRFTNGTDWDTWSGLWVQTFAGNHGAGINYDVYDIQNVNSTWATQYDALNDLKDVIERGTTQQLWQHVGAAKVLSALQLGTLTSYYGAIPWVEALQGGQNSTPKFDTQEEIYNEIFRLLSEAVVDLDKTTTVNLGAEDFAYGGNKDKWKALAYALEARYRNHFSKKDPAGSATAALTAVTNAKNAGFTAAAYDLTFPYEGTDKYLNGWFHMFENNQLVASEVFMNTLTNTNDPRKISYWNNKNTDGFDVGYVGKPNALGTTNVSYSPVGPQGFYGKNNSPQLIVTHFELLYIEAEAALRSGDGARAATALNAAIQAQLDLVTPASITFLTTSGGDVPAYQTEIANYITNFGSETAATVTLEKIMTEKHKAMVTMNGESWMDVRRHDYQYPATLSIPIKPDGNPVAAQFIQRVPYPQESLNTNSNTPKGVTIFDKLWLFN
ncbi:SusD/RagB family nutrient-binding outer membrane lipoprotein [Tenacibaculum aiptasiae]|uniref:SusD/RagB family nutrient-binding outer membrane lipoprotein n=1 Tax=Tenacibaculum aiptasiae TaxID=426481 RepID=UPI00232C0A06|nr:SusD/RagB family nutrient-binding outer membrane lipoprotein [Tenacibaculum aiptasiae]